MPAWGNVPEPYTHFSIFCGTQEYLDGIPVPGVIACKAPMAVPGVLLGRPFGAHGLSLVREVLGSSPGVPRAELARRVCQRLGWYTPGGALSLMSSRVALLRLHRRGLIVLPAPRNGNGNGRALAPVRFNLPVEAPLYRRVDQLRGLSVIPVSGDRLSALYNGLIERWHYLGFTPMAGAQIRYLVGWEEGWLGALGFGAAAWQVRDRDRFIGWDRAQRQSQLHRVVNNSRFLLLPWVHCPHLASKVLALSLRRLGADFRERYGYSPVLVESFVEEGRFAGTSYRAANWQCIGRTQGRGKLGQWQDQRLPLKTLWVYPLHSRFRQILTGATGAQP